MIRGRKTKRQATAASNRTNGAPGVRRRKNGTTCPLSRMKVIGTMTPGAPKPSWVFLARPAPDLDVALIHPAGGQRGGIEEIRREAVLAKFLRQPQPFVNPVADCAVAAGSPIGYRVSDKELAATRAVGRVPGAPHAMERKESEKEKMNERNEQLLRKCDRDLARHPARQLPARFLEISRPEARREPGASCTSASTKIKTGAVAAAASWAQAKFFPHQPGGSGSPGAAADAECPRIIRLTISAVPSLEPSSSTMTSSAPLPSAARTVISIFPASSRAGMRTAIAFSVRPAGGGRPISEQVDQKKQRGDSGTKEGQTREPNHSRP